MDTQEPKADQIPVKEDKRRVEIFVFITKSYKIRAKVREIDGTQFEVSVNSEQWKKGKAWKHEQEIMVKARRLLNTLEIEFQKADSYLLSEGCDCEVCLDQSKNGALYQEHDKLLNNE